MSNINIEVSLTAHTCPCGSVFATPHWLKYSGPCHQCLQRDIQDKNGEIINEVHEVNKLNHRIRGLKGAIKRLTKGKNAKIHK